MLEGGGRVYPRSAAAHSSPHFAKVRWPCVQVDPTLSRFPCNESFSCFSVSFFHRKMPSRSKSFLIFFGVVFYFWKQIFLNTIKILIINGMDESESTILSLPCHSANLSPGKCSECRANCQGPLPERSCPEVFRAIAFLGVVRGPWPTQTATPPFTFKNALLC